MDSRAGSQSQIAFRLAEDAPTQGDYQKLQVPPSHAYVAVEVSPPWAASRVFLAPGARRQGRDQVNCADTVHLSAKSARAEYKSPPSVSTIICSPSTHTGATASNPWLSSGPVTWKLRAGTLPNRTAFRRCSSRKLKLTGCSVLPARNTLAIRIVSAERPSAAHGLVRKRGESVTFGCDTVPQGPDDEWLVRIE